MKKRTYDMTTREAAKLATRDAVLRACYDVCVAERSFDVTLAAVAERAGVTVKTVLRHFGSRDEMLDAAVSRAYDEVIAERTAPQPDLKAALTALLYHYEHRGDMVLTMLTEEATDPRARKICTLGRREHRRWVEDVFGPRLPVDADARSRLIDVLTVATDVYSWKILRLDRGLSADEVHDRFLLMVESILTNHESLCGTG